MYQPLIFIIRSKNNTVELKVDANFAPSIFIFTESLPSYVFQLRVKSYFPKQNWNKFKGIICLIQKFQLQRIKKFNFSYLCPCIVFFSKNHKLKMENPRLISMLYLPKSIYRRPLFFSTQFAVNLDAIYIFFFFLQTKEPYPV